MTPLEELEMLAKDCEELALDAQNARDEGLKRAHLSIAYRIRRAIKMMPTVAATAGNRQVALDSEGKPVYFAATAVTEPRFFIDHGMIHDRATGKHVTTDGQPPFEDGIEQVLDLLNGLSGIAATPAPAFVKAAVDEYDQWMASDDQDAMSFLHGIMGRLRSRALLSQMDAEELCMEERRNGRERYEKLEATATEMATRIYGPLDNLGPEDNDTGTAFILHNVDDTITIKVRSPGDRAFSEVEMSLDAWIKLRSVGGPDTPPEPAATAGNRQVALDSEGKPVYFAATPQSAPAATIGDIPSEPRPPASAAMGLSAGGDTAATAGPDQIAGVYCGLDAEQSRAVDRQWAKQRGYILPTDGTCTVTPPEPAATPTYINPVDTHDWEKQIGPDGKWNLNSVCRRCKCELMPAYRGISEAGTSPCPVPRPNQREDGK